MGVRYLILTALMFFVAFFVAQAAFAHPQKMHNDKPQEQMHNVDKAGETTEHGHKGGGHDEAGGGHDEEMGEDAGGHSHWGISPDSTPFAKTMAYFGKFHPLVVHFPIALFLIAGFAQVLNIRSKDSSYDKTVTLLVWVGALGALGAGLLGWAHSGPVQAGENTLMSSHRWIGTGLLIGGLITAFIMTKAKAAQASLSSNKAFNFFLFAMAIGVAINGFLGGSLAHGGIKHLMPPGMM